MQTLRSPQIATMWLSDEGTPTRLLLFRHGEVDVGGRKLLYGQDDVPLSRRGIEQSFRTGLAMSRLRIDAVYTSDLVRAHTLAREISRHQGLQPHVDIRLRERHFGNWQGRLWEEIQRDDPDAYAAYQRDRFYTRVPGKSENFADLAARVLPAIREILARHPGQTVAITAHSGPTRVLLAHAFSMPLSSLFTFDQDYCCRNEVHAYPSGRLRVNALNDCTHLGT